MSSGLPDIDRLIGGLQIGDNVIWYDQAGSLAQVFCLNFMLASLDEGKPLVYVSFDKSPKTLLERLGPIAKSGRLTVMDCFTWGKGAGSDIFVNFYKDHDSKPPCNIIKVETPRDIDEVVDTLYDVHAALSGNVRFVFESLTGMQELWSGEDNVLNFYSHSCPRLYELDTIAYWIIEKDAHSQRLRAQINQIAQVVIDLAVKRGKTSLTVLKADGRNVRTLHEPQAYWTRDLEVRFEEERKTSGQLELGLRLKEMRTRRGLSQTELAKRIGVTPSTVSQIESNLIYPSLPALLKMAEVLGAEPSSFFATGNERAKQIVFARNSMVRVKLPLVSEDVVIANLINPVDLGSRTQAYLLEIMGRKTLQSHFMQHKGEEIGHLLSGKLDVTVASTVHKLSAGDTIYLTSEIPEKWRNPGAGIAKILWLTLS